MPRILIPNRLRVDGTLIDPPQRPRSQAAARAYEDAVATVYRRVADTRVGALLLSQLHLMVTIRLPSRDDGSASVWPRHPRHASPRGEPLYYCSDPQTIAGGISGQLVPREDQRRTTGRGSTAEIRFRAAQTLAASAPAPPDRPADTTGEWTPPLRQPESGLARADDDLVLVHELVHAAQATQGVLSCVAAPLAYDTFAEFCAILVQNIYASERGSHLVRDHQSWARRWGEEDWIQSRRRAEEAELRARFRQLMPAFTESLGNLPPAVAQYNPLRWWRP